MLTNKQIVLKIQEIVEECLGLKKGATNLNARNSNILQARQIVHYFARQHTINSTFREIGEIVGNKSNTTVMHSINVVHDRIEVDKRFQVIMKEIEKEIIDEMYD